MAKTGNISVITNTQNVEECFSNITIKGYITTTGESYRGSHRSGTYEVYRDDSYITSGSFTSGAPANSTTELFSVTLDIYHYEDGNSGVITVNYNYDNGWCKATWSDSLSPIQRTFSLTFDPNDGDIRKPGGNLYNGVNENSVPVTYGSSNYYMMSGDIPTRDGYTFLGWYTSTNGGTKIYDSSGNCINDGTYWKNNFWNYLGDLTVYAQWIKNEFTVSFNGNGGLINNAEVATFEKTNGVDFDLSNILPIKYGYTFKYWLARKDDTTLQINDGVCIEYDNSVLQRVWLKRIVSAKTKGWEILAYAPSASSFTAPTWTASGNQDDLTWHKLEVGEWTRDWNGESLFFNFGTWIETSSHNNELTDYITHLYAYDSTGNNIVQDSVGHYYHVEFYSSDSYSYNQDVALYAQWKPNIYSLHIDLTGGNINGESSSILFEDSITFNQTTPDLLDINIPVRKSYEFAGYYDIDGIQVFDKNGNAVECKYWNSDGVYSYDGDLILYAHWKPLNIIHYKTNGEWKLCRSYIKVDNTWKPAIMYIKSNDVFIR